MVCINSLKVVCMQLRVLLAKPRSTLYKRHSSVNSPPQNSKILTPPFLPIRRLRHNNCRIWQRLGSLSSPLLYKYLSPQELMGDRYMPTGRGAPPRLPNMILSRRSHREEVRYRSAIPLFQRIDPGIPWLGS